MDPSTSCSFKAFAREAAVVSSDTNSERILDSNNSLSDGRRRFAKLRTKALIIPCLATMQFFLRNRNIHIDEYYHKFSFIH